jgi:hypothetical protein
MNCNYCTINKGVYKKKVVKSVHYSGDVCLKYETIWVCDDDTCYGKFLDEKKQDREICLKLFNK